MKKIIKIFLAAFILCTASLSAASADPFETKMGAGFWCQYGFSVPVIGFQFQCWPVKYVGLSVTSGTFRIANYGYSTIAGDLDILLFQSAFSENNGVRIYAFGQAAYNRIIAGDKNYAIPEYAGGLGAEFVFGKHFGLPVNVGYSYLVPDGDKYDDEVIGSIVAVGARARF